MSEMAIAVATVVGIPLAMFIFYGLGKAWSAGWHQSKLDFLDKVRKFHKREREEK